MAGTVRADEPNVLPVAADAADSVSTGAPRSSNTLNQVAPGLLLPTSVLDQHDSQLLRELLLVQGIELDLGERELLDRTAVLDLWQTFGLDEVLSATLDLELLSRHTREGVVSVHSAIIFPDSAPPVENHEHGISKDWQILWLDQDRGSTSSTRFEQPEPQSTEFVDGVTTGWNVEMVLTRPATPEEIQLLQAQTGSTGGGFAAALSSTPAVTGTQSPGSVGSELQSTEESPAVSENSATVPGTGTGLAATGAGLAAPVAPGTAVPDISQAGSNPPVSPPGSSDDESFEGRFNVAGVPIAADDLQSGTGAAGTTDEEARNTTEAVTDGLFSISEDVPEGFEQLAGPQTYVVDIVFNGVTVGATGITAIDDEVIIDVPEELLAMLPGVLQPEVVLAELSAPLPANLDKICYGLDEPEGCGQLEVDVVGVIFNENDLTLDVFIASAYQAKQSIDRDRYLPPPEQANTTILSVQAVASDLQNDESSVDLAARALAGYGRGHLSTELDYNTRTERQRLHEFKLTHHFTDYELIAGTYAYHPGGGLRDIPLVGTSVATSLKTRIDLEHAFSTELVVYLQRRSVVQLVVDDRVYAGDSYAAGNQVLDTSNLPDGTYEVEIRILDPQSGSRVERRLFTKSTQIPPRDETVYQFTAGVPLLFNDNHIFPDTTDSVVGGVSLSRRLTDQSAYRLGLVQLDSNSLLQAEYIYLGEHVSFQLTGSVGGENTSASAVRAGWHKDSLSLSLSAEHFSSDVDAGDNQVYEQFYSDDYRQVSFSLNRAYKTFSVGGRWNYRENDGEAGLDEARQYALYYRRPLLRHRYLKGFFDASVQVDEFDERLNLQVKFFVDRGNWSSGIGSEVSLGENDTDVRGTVDTRWRNSDKERYQWSVGLYADTNELGESAGASLALDHPWYQAGLSSDINLNAESGQRQNSLAFVSANFGADARGIALGGADFAQAGVIIDVRGEPAGARFDILIDEIKASSGEIGTRQFIGLRPYQNYRIRLRPQTLLSNGLDEKDYEFTLFPGGVKRIDLVAEQKILLIATLVNQFGELIENAVVDYETNPVLIEAGGFFQAEVIPGDTLTVNLSSGEQCEFIVPPPDGEEVLVLDEPILCRALTGEDDPQ